MNEKPKTHYYVLCDPINPHARAKDIANARLIAAAPMLLEAAQLMVEGVLIRKHGYVVTKDTPDIKRLQLAIDQALGKGVGNERQL